MQVHGQGHGIQQTRGILDVGGSAIDAVIGTFAITNRFTRL